MVLYSPLASPLSGSSRTKLSRSAVRILRHRSARGIHVPPSRQKRTTTKAVRLREASRRLLMLLLHQRESHRNRTHAGHTRALSRARREV